MSTRSMYIGRILGISMVAVILCFLIGWSANYNGIGHMMIGFCVLFFLLGISMKNPATALYLLTLYLPFMGIIRRYLTVSMGLLSLDPLVVIAPVIVLLLGSFWYYRYLIVQDIQMRDSQLFGLVRWFTLIEIVEVVNPLQHGFTVGLTGILFYVVPMFWMVAGRVYFNDATIRKVIHSVFILGIIVALYGLKQTFIGFFPFEQKWASIAGYTALHVGNKLRAFSTPDNAQEYGVYLSIAMSVAWIYVIRGKISVKIIGITGAAILGVALFMESARGPIVLSVLAIGVTSIFNAKTSRTRLFTMVAATSVVTACFVLIGHMAPTPENALITHQITGLTHPFNSQDSSLMGHFRRMFAGIVDGIKVPIGRGLGSTTVGAAKFDVSNQGTEVDVSNVFVSTGIVGGAVYVLIMARSLYACVAYTRRLPFVSLITLGILTASLGQWLNGGLYSTSAVTWLLLGYLDRMTATISARAEDEMYTSLPPTGFHPQLL